MLNSKPHKLRSEQLVYLKPGHTKNEISDGTQFRF